MISAMVATLAFALHDGDHVLFYGDSITEQRLYTTYVETFVRTRYPKLKVDFTTVGIGGDATWGGWTAASDERVKRDVAPYKPTRITIMLGMNDGGYVAYEPRIDGIFTDWYDKLLGWMNQAVPGAKYTLIETSPFDDFSGQPSDFKGYNDSLRKYGVRVKEVATKHGYEFVDFNDPVANAITKARAVDPKVAKTFLPDTIHPGPSGHLIMAGELLKSWGADSLVSALQIDAATHQVVSQNGTVVSNLNSLSWDQLDQSLPFPVDAGMKPGETYSDFTTQLNQQTLAVTHLLPGHYELAIDGNKLPETFTADQLSAGINLAMLETPMQKQAMEVLDLAIKRNDAWHTGWFNVAFLLKDFKTSDKAEKALFDLAQEIDEHEREVAQPISHHFELSRKGD